MLNYEKSSLKRILVDGGYYEEDKYYFYLRDHMGNNRVVADASGSAIQVTHYYPFGMSFAEGYEKEGIKPAKQPYKYNGKELDGENSLNWYDYEARQLAMDVPRFTSMNPHAENYYNISPYVYAADNPMRFIDPDGRDYWSTNNPDEIARFLNTVKSPGGGFENFEFASWETHLTDNEFLEGMKDLGSLTFDDEAGLFYSSETSIENGEIVVNGYSYPAEFVFDKMASLSTGRKIQSGRLDVMGADGPLFLALTVECII